MRKKSENKNICIHSVLFILAKKLTKDVFYAGKKPTYFLQKKKRTELSN
jgi:hypothetical protein